MESLSQDEASKPANSSQLKSPFGLKSLPPLPGLMLTVFVDLLAFGMFIPDLQLRGKEFGLSGIELGLLFASFSGAQVISSPWLGHLSDNRGRRVVLISSSILSVFAYLVYANLNHLIFLLVVSRVLLGIASSNLGVAFAYAADISTDEQRARSVGSLGAAVGVGFILGPVLGAGLLKLGGGGTAVLGYTGSFLVFLNLLYIVFFLPEPIRDRKESQKRKALDAYKIAFQTPSLAILLVMLTFLSLGFTNLESTFFLLLSSSHGPYHLPDNSARTAGAILLGLVGVCSAFSQGFLVRALAPKLGEATILRICYPIMGILFFFVPYSSLWLPAILLFGTFALTSGLANPSLNSLLSRAAPDELQGSTFGIAQSLQGFARLFGPLISLPLFAIKISYPYELGAALIVFGAAISMFIKLPGLNQTETKIVEA